MREFLPVARPLLRQPLRAVHLFAADRMRPRFAEAESRGGFLGGELGGRFNNRSQRIAHHAGVFPVGVVDAPDLVAWLWRATRRRIHGSSQYDAPS